MTEKIKGMMPIYDRGFQVLFQSPTHVTGYVRSYCVRSWMRTPELQQLHERLSLSLKETRSIKMPQMHVHIECCEH